jgi:hypothetical protein
LKRLRRDLLGEIADWFHRIHKKHIRGRELALRRFVAMTSSVENPIIISFNWDYELDRALCDTRDRRDLYGLRVAGLNPPVILKPHGSLNWYRYVQGKHIKRVLREILWEGKKKRRAARYCFLNWRAPKSSRRRYIPWIVPPTHVKSFEHPMLRRVWRTCVDCLSVARSIYFLGYSLPAADWHSRYIFRCGFHNQMKGRPSDTGDREDSTGRASVFVVNPRDEAAYKRIQTAAGYNCTWIRSRVKDWLRETT